MAMSKEERIRRKMCDNMSKDELQRSYGYCKAFVEGEMAIEEAVRNNKMANIRIDVTDKQNVAIYRHGKLVYEDAIEKPIVLCQRVTLDGKDFRLETHSEYGLTLWVNGEIVYQFKEELKVGLPIGFEFPWNKRDEWTDCCNELYEQGFEIIKK